MNEHQLLEVMTQLPSTIQPADSDEEHVERLFQALLDVRGHFAQIHGLLKTEPEYMRAAEIYRGLLEPLLAENPKLRERIPERFVYF